MLSPLAALLLPFLVAFAALVLPVVVVAGHGSFDRELVVDMWLQGAPLWSSSALALGACAVLAGGGATETAKLLLLRLPVAVGVTMVWLVCMGAPVVGQAALERTMLAAVTLTSLSVLPLARSMAWQAAQRGQRDGKNIPRQVFGPVFALLGACCGAYVLPMDWGEDWQQWPLPVVVGGVVGFAAGHFGSIFSSS